MSVIAAVGPWWVMLVLSLPGAAAVIVRSVFPQESADRLAWWRERRLHRERLARARTPSIPLAPPGDDPPQPPTA